VVSIYGYYDVLGSKIYWITKKQNHRGGALDSSLEPFNGVDKPANDISAMDWWT
jgi:hypothetical protein